MYTRIVVIALVTLFAATGCKASEQSATRDDSEAESAQAVAPEQEEQKAQKEQGGAAESDAGESETSQAPTREQLGPLSKAATAALKDSQIFQTWQSAQEAGNTALLGWYPFGTEGSDKMGPAASALRSYMETVSVNELPVDVAALDSLASRKGVTLRKIGGATEVERLANVATALGLPYVASGILIRDESSGSAIFKLRVLVVEPGASEAAFDATVAAE